MSGNPMDNGYIQVADRHLKWKEEYKDGIQRSELLSFIFDPAQGKGYAVVKVQIFARPDDTAPQGEGLAGMPIPGPTSFTRNSEIENAETSALGRALAAAGYHPKESMASKDEIAMKNEAAAKPVAATQDDPPATKEQKDLIQVRRREAGISDEILKAMRVTYTGKLSSAQFTNSDVQKMLAGINDVAVARAAAEAVGGELIPA